MGCGPPRARGDLGGHMVLEVRGLRHAFDGLQALQGVDLLVAPGECVALIGPNGAGKSTLFACVCGQLVPQAGQVTWQGQALNGLAPAQRLKRGVARSFQVAQVFEALTVQANVQLALRGAQGVRWWDRLSSWQVPEAQSLMHEVGLGGQGEQSAATLSYGAKKRLELALALAGLQSWGHGPTGLLLLDEPAAGLAASERAALMVLVQRLARQGLAVLYTEHNMDAVFGVADRVLVLMDGRIQAEGTAEAVAQDPQVQQRYLGRARGLPHA